MLPVLMVGLTRADFEHEDASLPLPAVPGRGRLVAFDPMTVTARSRSPLQAPRC